MCDIIYEYNYMFTNIYISIVYVSKIDFFNFISLKSLIELMINVRDIYRFFLKFTPLLQRIFHCQGFIFK